MPSLYQIALFVHVIAAFVLIGSSLSAPLIRKAIRGSVSVLELRHWLAYSERASRANPPAALILLGSGIYLGSAGWWTEGWFYVSIVAWIADTLLALLVIRRLEGGMANAPDAATIDLLRGARSWDYAEASMIASDFAMVWVMLNKPALLHSVALLLAANALAIAIVMIRTVRIGSRLARLSA